jgi:hypothetical protein
LDERSARHKHRMKAHTYIHALSGVRTHDPRVPGSEDSSYLRPGGYRDRRFYLEHKINDKREYFFENNMNYL